MNLNTLIGKDESRELKTWVHKTGTPVVVYYWRLSFVFSKGHIISGKKSSQQRIDVVLTQKSFGKMESQFDRRRPSTSYIILVK